MNLSYLYCLFEHVKVLLFRCLLDIALNESMLMNARKVEKFLTIFIFIPLYFSRQNRRIKKDEARARLEFDTQQQTRFLHKHAVKSIEK